MLPGVLELPTEEGQNLVLKGSLVLLVLSILVCHARISLNDVVVSCSVKVASLFSLCCLYGVCRMIEQWELIVKHLFSLETGTAWSRTNLGM